MNMLPSISKQYFWDVDFEKIDIDTSRRLIIERVFSMGDVDDLKTVIAYYGRDEVVRVLMNLNYLDPKTLNFASKLFDQPIESFRCYKRKRLNRQHWNS